MDTIESLSNDELREELMKFGVKPGPVVGTTRTVYIAKLRKLMAAADTDQPSRNDGKSFLCETYLMLCNNYVNLQL
jgi:hypothetical protein